MSNHAPDRDKPRLSLRLLFVLVTVFGCWLGMVLAIHALLESATGASMGPLWEFVAIGFLGFVPPSGLWLWSTLRKT